MLYDSVKRLSRLADLIRVLAAKSQARDILSLNNSISELEIELSLLADNLMLETLKLKETKGQRIAV